MQTLVATDNTTGPLPWTQQGIDRAKQDLARKKAVYDACMRQHGDGECHTGSPTDARAQDLTAHKDECELKRGEWAAAHNLVARLRPVKLPANLVRVQSGAGVELEHLDDNSRLDMGAIERIIVGGPGENDSTSEPHTLSCLGPLAKALLGKEVGEEITITPPSGKPYAVEIRKIFNPTTEISAQPATAVGKKVAQPAAH